MRIFWIILSLFIAVVLQTALVPLLDVFVPLGGIDLVLVLAFIYVILWNFKNVWWAVVAAGYLIDTLSGLPFGLISFSLVGSAYLVGWLNQRVLSSANFWAKVMLVEFGVIVYTISILVLAGIFKVDLVFNIWGRLFVDLAAAAVCLYGFKKILHPKPI